MLQYIFQKFNYDKFNLRMPNKKSKIEFETEKNGIQCYKICISTLHSSLLLATFILLLVQYQNPNSGWVTNRIVDSVNCTIISTVLLLAKLNLDIDVTMVNLVTFLTLCLIGYKIEKNEWNNMPNFIIHCTN